MKSIILQAMPAIGPIILFILVLCAAWADCRTFRIPNRLVVSGMAIGLAISIALPVSDGSLTILPSSNGILAALGGAGIGFGIFFPLYLSCTMGAGDVKLMAMIGVFLGPRSTLIVIVLSFIVGGALSLVIAFKNGKLGLMWVNVYDAMLGVFLHFPVAGIGKVHLARQSAGTMPYALAISGGVFLYFLFGNEIDRKLN